MSSILEIEKAASRLRRDLKLAQLPELKLLCGLKFFDSVASHPGARLESYVREFIPWLAIAAGKSDPQEFLPGETESLEKLIDILKTQPTGVVSSDDINAFSCLADRIDKSTKDSTPAASTPGSSVRITCLFVEHYPDLDLPPRGRILNLIVTTSRISSKAEDDDVVVRNPVSEPDDRFLAQARDSIKAARAYLFDRYGLPQKKRYRFDYAVDSSGARFTGDSLGVAFAVGAIAALAKVEVFRDKLSVSPHVAFSGALSSDGRLSPVDSDALKLKIYRAFHSVLKHLVIPRKHLADAQAHVLVLEKRHPDRRLDLAGAETLEAVTDDPRLLSTERSSAATYVARKAWKAKRSVWVEVPALLVLLAVLFSLVAPARYMPWFDDNPAFTLANQTNSSLDVFNRDSVLLWTDAMPCTLAELYYDYPVLAANMARTFDIDGDGRNEVLALPKYGELCDEQGWIRVYSHDGRLRSGLFAGFPGDENLDNPEIMYDAYSLYVEPINGSPGIITEITKVLGALSCIRLFDSAGNCRGSYVNDGATSFRMAQDINGDLQDELFFLNFYNPQLCASLLVLRSDTVCGESPPPSDSTQLGGNQLAYVLFPVSDLGKVPGELISESNAPGIHGIEYSGTGQVYAYVSESSKLPPASIIYTVDARFRVTGATANNSFKRRYRELVDAGSLPPVDDWPNFEAIARDAVIYWTDTGWVTEGQLRAAENARQ